MLQEALDNLESRARIEPTLQFIKPSLQTLPLQRKVAKKTQTTMKKIGDFSERIIKQRNKRQAKIDARTERMQDHGRYAVKKYVTEHPIYRFMSTPFLSTEQKVSLNKQRAVLP